MELTNKQIAHLVRNQEFRAEKMKAFENSNFAFSGVLELELVGAQLVHAKNVNTDRLTTPNLTEDNKAKLYEARQLLINALRMIERANELTLDSGA